MVYIHFREALPACAMVAGRFFACGRGTQMNWMPKRNRLAITVRLSSIFREGSRGIAQGSFGDLKEPRYWHYGIGPKDSPTKILLILEKTAGEQPGFCGGRRMRMGLTDDASVEWTPRSKRWEESYLAS